MATPPIRMVRTIFQIISCSRLSSASDQTSTLRAHVSVTKRLPVISTAEEHITSIKIMLSNRFLSCLSRCQVRSQFEQWISIHTIRMSGFHTNRKKNDIDQTRAIINRQRRQYSFIHDTSYLCYGSDYETDVALFEMFKNQDTGLLHIGKFLSAVKATGLRKTDLRLQDMMENLKKLSKTKSDGNDVDTQKLTLEQFRSIVQPNVGLLSYAFRHQFIIPEFQEFSKELELIYWKCKENTSGTRLAGREDLGFNNAVFLSERECADRNYALGFYMREHKCFPESSKFRECMDFYFQCCSLEVNCDLVAVMAATLANGGICPLSEEKVLKPESVRDVLSLMHSCGMYDYSGQFAFKVGLPAKSGVSGAMLVVVPNVMGMCLYSPPLDALGNSCRGVQFCEELVKKFNFHRYDNLRHASDKSDPRKHKFETKGLNIVNLLFSAASGDLPSLRRHKLSGMDMTLSDYDGRTALHLAAAEGHLHCVEFLLKYCNVQYDVRDRWGRTPLEEATAFGHTTVVEMLQQWVEEGSKKSNNNTRAEDDPLIPDFISKNEKV
ncbi:glutaminase liver isoform, mitochondrial isoform X2 [Diabrotica virgifera virgifera]|uniref:glutaminase n=1 Tax=Diabrotica virgifera virgifera TaxID=50390 RepID=A0ABM5L9I8_DIAVI|nr:glutaminase liver isoform, mitochondrial isoform X2 [Diabrotica virgifera virgifera]